MRKNSYSKIIFILISVSILIIILSILIIVFEKEVLGETLYTILLEVDKSLIITVVIGAIIKLISNEIFEVKKNDDKLRKIGIFQIGAGRLDNKQSNIMFGGYGYEYPRELKFVFISGIHFFSDFKDRLLEAIKNGCVVKCMLADPNLSKDFLIRTEDLGPERKTHNYFELEQALKHIEEIITEAKNNNYPGSFEVRHYIDEYRYSYRIATYYKGERKGIIRLWANFQPHNKYAVDLSLGVHGMYDDNFAKSSVYRDNESSDSIVLSMNKSFDALWKKYSSTSNKYLFKEDK